MGHAVQVAIVGAGIIGLTTAWALVRQGVSVTLIDQGEPGRGASGGNGGQLSYDFVAPLADPSVWMKIPSLLLDPESPVQIRFRPDPALMGWLFRFLMACNRSSASRTTATLLELAHTSRRLADEFFADGPLDTNYAVPGKLVVYRDQASLQAARKQMELQAALGSKQSCIGADECVAIEPALKRQANVLQGAIWTPTEAVVDTQKLCDVLMQKLQASPGFQTIRAQATGLLGAANIHGVRTSVGDLRADACIVAAGVGSRGLLEPLGIKVPLEPLKGYSLSIPVLDPTMAPRVSITDSARKIVYARLGSRLRVAGMAELVGMDRRVEPRRVEHLLRNAQALFGPFGDFDAVAPWIGFRPATPTGLPIVGSTRIRNLFLNIGHGGLGLTLSFVTAQAVARAVMQQRGWANPLDLKPA